MTLLYVASSKALGEWGAEVGLTKHLFKVGLADDGPEAALAALNAGKHAGRDDWKMLKSQAADGIGEAAMLERLSRKEKLVDPKLYPGIKGAVGIVKVKPTNAENHFVVKRALAGESEKMIKLKPIDIAVYLMVQVLGAAEES